ncbi:MAG: GNAT family N-acetyltransferase, partial [Candidatus Competibacterales bacterium]|nr:GNAT family N-acetyltransferase [Candidatus Competibacterales bacterium]
MPLTLFEQFAQEAGYFGVAWIGGEPAGFLIGLLPQTDYASLNFRWFRQRYDDFCYIDRVVVATAYRRHGIGRLLYRDLETRMRGRTAQLACEVNLRPRNEPSLRFHAALGFRPVGTQYTDSGAKTVQLMLRPLE